MFGPFTFSAIDESKDYVVLEKSDIDKIKTWKDIESFKTYAEEMTAKSERRKKIAEEKRKKKESEEGGGGGGGGGED